MEQIYLILYGDCMKISDFMEIVVVDKNGMHKMETTEDISRYLNCNDCDHLYDCDNNFDENNLIKCIKKR